MDLFYGFLLIIIAQIGTFFQLQGQFLWPWMSKNPWAPALLGFPISYLFIQSVKHTVTWFDGQLWPVQLDHQIELPSIVTKSPSSSGLAWV